MTKDQIKALVAEKIAGQGSAIDVAGALPDIIDATVDIIPAAQIQSDWNQTDNDKADYIKNKPAIPTIPTIPTAAEYLADLTLESSAASITTASDLTKTQCATAMGITEDELDDLMAGNYIRFAYGTDHSSIAAVVSASGDALQLGSNIAVALSTDTYAITVS